MTAYLIVRAEVEKESRDKFDHWYETEHLPDALREFKAVSAMRGWSDIEANVHLAFYEFPDLPTVNNLLSSDLMKEFIKEFDSHWAGKVTSTGNPAAGCSYDAASGEQASKVMESGSERMLWLVFFTKLKVQK